MIVSGTGTPVPVGIAKHWIFIPHAFGVVDVADDLELQQRGMPVHGYLVGVGQVER